jgi:glutathione S-transferase
MRPERWETTMKIIEDGRAPNPRRVRVFLAEKGVSLPFEQIDIMKGDHRSADFRRLNPMERVPILVLDDGETLSETMAICRYFEALHPDPPLFGESALGRARVEMWNRRMEFELLFPIAQIVRHGVAAMAPLEQPQVADWAEANKPRVARMLAYLDGELRHRPYIAGDAFTVADITAMVAIDFLRVARIRPEPELAHLARWREAVSARPSAKA